MAYKPRSRTIKPSFFVSEDLSELPFEARLIFAGLWTLADREGRLEERPKQIKALLMPYDDVDMDKILMLLDKKTVIQRYEINGQRLINIPNFSLHQKVHPHEAQSELPEPQQDRTLSLHVIKSNDKVNHTHPLQEVEREVIQEVEKEKEQEVEKGIMDFVEKYHKICGVLKKAKIINNSRKGKIRQRLKELAAAGITVEEYMYKISNSKFLRGEKGDWDGADFDFIIGAENIGKILDGKYDDREIEDDPFLSQLSEAGRATYLAGQEVLRARKQRKKDTPDTNSVQ